MRGDAVHDERIFTVLRRDLDAELHVRPFVLVREDLADVVEQGATLREYDVETQLARHDAGEPCDLLGVLQDVLTVTRAPMHPAHELHQLGVEAVNARLVCRLLADLEDLRIDFLARLVDDLLDAPRVDAAVGDELLERESGDLAPNWIEAGDDHGIWRVIDDHVDAGGELERTNISTLASDDAPLHLVIRERHGGHGALRRVLGGDALNGEGDDLLRLPFSVAACRLANLAHAIRRIGLRFLLHATHELGLRVLGGHTCHLLEAAPLFGDESRELLFALHNCLLASAELARSAAELSVSLLEDIGLAIENILALGDPSFLPLYFLAAAAHLGLELLAQPDQLLLSGNDRALSQVLSFALALRDDPLRGLLCRRLRRGQSLDLGRSSNATPEKEESRRGEYDGAKRGCEYLIHMDLCSTALWAAG